MLAIFVYAGISLPLQQVKDELCETVNQSQPVSTCFFAKSIHYSSRSF